MKTKRRIIASAIVLVIAVFIGKGIVNAARSLSTPEAPIPTARVERGDVQIDVFTSGELRAPHSISLIAPSVNGTLQIVSMASTGAAVKPGDVVIQFDPSEQQYNFEQAESQLRQAEQDITKAKADAAVQAAQDQTDLLKARFDVRRAELEVGRNELVSSIDAEKNNLALEEAKRKLAQLEQDVKSRATSGQAGIRVLEEKRNAARLAMDVAKHNIENMTLKSTISGIVAAKENRDTLGGICCFPGMVLPEYRAGDLVQSGRVLADVLDIDQMEVQAKVSETDRSNIAPNESAEVQIDAHPGEVLPAKVKTVAGLAPHDFWGGNSQAKFPATFQLERNSPDLRPGISALVKVHGVRLSDVLYLPAQSLFDKDGKPVVYVKHGDDFQATAVKVKYRSESRIVIEGLQEGTEVSVINPTNKQKSGPRSSSMLASGAL
ncbi:MAG TPA: HlyD family efflux transporter periplasmic adaptor subunit [Terriglobales bacterium]|nr:HlyD family efflux transporter periplasmic adaptor subunit [Terriglobales bacterium]